MKIARSILVSCLLLIASTTTRAVDILLTDAGQSPYTILTSKNPSPAESLAAAELA